MAFHEKHSRSLVKALTYRALITLTDGIIIYAVTRRTDITLGFAIASNLINTILYFFHERAWNKVHWGKSHVKK